MASVRSAAELDQARRTTLADALVRTAAVIERRWLKRITRELEVGHFRPTDLRDGLGHYLQALARALRGADTLLGGGSAAWAEIAREHALTRVRLGFDVDELVHELNVLRQTMTEVIHEDLREGCTYAEPLADLVGAAVAAAVKSYVEARDYAARRLEAEHVGFLAHRLRTPLASALLSVERLRQVGAPAAEDQRALELLNRSLGRLASLVDDVLLGERLEAGVVGVKPIETSLAALVSDAVQAIRPTAEAKGLEIVVRVDPALTLFADPKLTYAALEHLIENAVKYTDSGRIEVAAERTPNGMAVHIRDNCPGISEAELKIIFEPFRRGQTQKGGTGLGLTIARRAVEAQGGTIGAESPGERGCHFWFVLPSRPGGTRPDADSA